MTDQGLQPVGLQTQLMGVGVGDVGVTTTEEPPVRDDHKAIHSTMI